jgi:uncharacterized protein YjbJ (UPF0337 family)
MDNDRIKGKGKEAAGSVREKTGKAIGNEEMEAKGAGQKYEGKAQSMAGKAKDKIKDKID